MGIHVGVNGTPKECSDIYVGVNGTPKSCYSGVKPGETIFTSSSTFTVPKGVKKIDVFCVGGGGGGYVSRGYSPNGWHISGAGGGGGYTSTVLDVDVSEGQEIAVTVGAGGYGYYLDNGVGIFNLNPTNGGTSKIDYDGPLAIGGVATSSESGAKGGSGGGGGGITNFNGYKVVGGAGGIDGGDGGGSSRFSGGKGQGTTTRYFGESTGTLYASGGCGYVCANPFEPIAYGDGGSGAYSSIEKSNGRSGICIIRWGKQ